MAQQLRDGEARFYRTFGFLQRHGALCKQGRDDKHGSAAVPLRLRRRAQRSSLHLCCTRQTQQCYKHL